jgi:hypothetical protein
MNTAIATAPAALVNINASGVVSAPFNPNVSQNCAGMIQGKDYHEGREMAWHKMTVVNPALALDNCNAGKWHAIPTPLLANGMDTGFKICIASDKPDLIIGKPFADSYGLINNHELMATMKSAFTGIDGVTLDSHGTLNGRSTLYFSFMIDKSIHGRGDHKLFLQMLNGLGDRQNPLRFFGSGNRIVCQNTYRLALQELKTSTDQGVKIRHTKNAAFSLPKIEAYVENLLGASREFFAILDKLENTSVKDETAKAIFAGFIGEGEEMSTRAVNTVQRLEVLAKTGAGNGRGTLGDLFHAVTDFYSHESAGGEDLEKQWLSSEFGSGANKKEEFLPLLANNGNRIQLIAKGKRSLELTALADKAN